MQSLVQISSPERTPSLNYLQKQTDRELVDMYMGGNEHCLEILVNRHKAQLFAFIMRRTGNNRDWANDVFQETFFKVIRSLKEGLYTEEDKFLAWVMRISRNMIIDAQRRKQRIRMISTVKNSEGEKQDIFNVIDVGEKINIRHFEKRQAHRQIRHLIKRLPDTQRQVLIMREYFDMSFKEIKRFRRMNINTALGAMRYALINLRKMAKEEGIRFE
jgi:RNA polymerase sigma-70 factor (ECF subfamily)